MDLVEDAAAAAAAEVDAAVAVTAAAVVGTAAVEMLVLSAGNRDTWLGTAFKAAAAGVEAGGMAAAAAVEEVVATTVVKMGILLVNALMLLVEMRRDKSVYLHGYFPLSSFNFLLFLLVFLFFGF